jgi:tight adherence protein B
MTANTILEFFSQGTGALILSQAFFGLAFLFSTLPFRKKIFTFVGQKGPPDIKRKTIGLNESEIRKNAQIASICLFPLMIIAGFSIWIALVLTFLSYCLSPRFMLFKAQKEFFQAFDASLPDSLSSISGSLKAGLTIQKSLEVAVVSCPKIFANEAKQVLREYGFGTGIDQALEGVRVRVKTPATNMSFGALILGRKLGGPLPLILSRIADTVRERLRVEGKLQSLTAQGRAQGFILCGAPFVVGFGMALFDKAKFALLTDTLPGQVILGVAAVLWILGVGITWKVMQLEV